MNVLKVLNELESESGKKAKLDILNKNKDVPFLKEFFESALNPYKTFYIKKIPSYATAGRGATMKDVFVFLDRLMERKVTGHAAQAELADLLSKLSADDAEVTRRIIIKDPRCGCQESTANNVWPDLIPTYPCLLAKAYDAKSIKKIVYPAISQVKSDGMRFNAIVKSGGVTFFSRAGRQLDLRGYMEMDFAALAAEAGGDFVFDGELRISESATSLVPVSRKVGNGMLNKAIKGTISDDEAALAYANIWDIIPLADFQARNCKIKYKDRLAQLKKAISRVVEPAAPRYVIIEGKVVNSFEEAQEHFQEMHAAGEEGTMLKNFNGLWEDTRSKDIVKMKSEKECELRVTGYKPGKPGTKREGKIGSLDMATDDGKVQANVSGFSDELLDEITKNIDQWIGSICTIRYNERITSQQKGRESVDSLFLPRFVIQRLDKSVTDKSDQVK